MFLFHYPFYLSEIKLSRNVFIDKHKKVAELPLLITFPREKGFLRNFKFETENNK